MLYHFERNEFAMKRKNILICGQPNTVLRIFIEHLHENYNIFFISDSKELQYLKIKKMLGKNTFLVDGDSAKNMLKLILTSFRILFKNKMNIFLAYHNHFIKNGMMLFIVKWFFPDINRIYFPYDILSYAFPEKLKYKSKSRLSYFFDRICFEKSHKIITKGFEDELKYLQDTYKIYKKPHFVFNLLIEEKDTVNKTATMLKKDDKIHLASIGGVKNPAIGDNNYIVFKELLKEKNIVLHVYSHTSELLEDLKHDKNLCIHPYIKDHNELVKKISKYDFGVSLSSPVQSNFIQAKMASGVRVYDYLSAGLPVIIDSEHTSMANMIMQNNFGIVIPLKDIKNIMHYIDKCDYNSLISFVKENREKYYVDKNIDKLTLFLEK